MAPPSPPAPVPAPRPSASLLVGALPARRGRWRELRRQSGIYVAFFAQFIKSRLAYRVDFVVDLLANLFSIAVQLSILTAIFGQIRALHGWSFEQVLFIYGFSLLPLGLFNLVSVNLYSFSEHYIAEGNFDRVLLRPVNPLGQVLFEEFNASGLNELFLGAGIMIYAGAALGLDWGLLDLLALILLAGTASLVYTGVFLGLTSVSFWVEDRMGLSPPVYNVIRFARYPITIFSLPVRILLTFVLPFAWVAFYPAAWFVGTSEFRRFSFLTPLVGIIVFGLAYAIWRRGVSQYSSTGT